MAIVSGNETNLEIEKKRKKSKSRTKQHNSPIKQQVPQGGELKTAQTLEHRWEGGRGGWPQHEEKKK